LSNEENFIIDSNITTYEPSLGIFMSAHTKSLVIIAKKVLEIYKS